MDPLDAATPKEKATYQKEIVQLLSMEGKFAEATVVVNEILKNGACGRRCAVFSVLAPGW